MACALYFFLVFFTALFLLVVKGFFVLAGMVTPARQACLMYRQLNGLCPLVSRSFFS